MKKQTKSAKKSAPTKSAPVKKAAAHKSAPAKKAKVAEPPQAKLSKKQQEIHPDVLAEDEQVYTDVAELEPAAQPPLTEQQLETLRSTFGNLSESDLQGDRDEILKKVQQRTGKGIAQLEVLIAG